MTMATRTGRTSVSGVGARNGLDSPEWFRGKIGWPRGADEGDGRRARLRLAANQQVSARLVRVRGLGAVAQEVVDAPLELAVGGGVALGQLLHVPEVQP